MLDGVLGVSIGVAAYYLTTRPILLFLVFKTADGRTGHFMRIFATPCAIILASIGVATSTATLLMRLATIAFFAPVLHVPLMRIFARSAYRDIREATLRIVTRKEPGRGLARP